MAGKHMPLLQMPRVSGNTHIGHFQERFTHYPRNLETVAVLRFHVRDESLQRGAQRLLPIKSEHGGLDLPSHEEKGPSGFLNRLLKRRTSVFDRYPSIRTRLALQQERTRQVGALLNPNATRCDWVSHGCVSSRHPGVALAQWASHITGWLRTSPFRWAEVLRHNYCLLSKLACQADL